MFPCSKQDRSVIELQRNADNDEGESEVDEIKEYINTRYIAPIEACMHFGGVPIYVCMPPVRLLPCHLPGEQYIYSPSPRLVSTSIAQFMGHRVEGTPAVLETDTRVCL